MAFNVHLFISLFFKENAFSWKKAFSLPLFKNLFSPKMFGIFLEFVILHGENKWFLKVWVKRVNKKLKKNVKIFHIIFPKCKPPVFFFSHGSFLYHYISENNIIYLCITGLFFYNTHGFVCRGGGIFKIEFLKNISTYFNNSMYENI